MLEGAAQPTRPARAPQTSLHLDLPRSKSPPSTGVAFFFCLDTGEIGSIAVHYRFESSTCTRQVLRLSTLSTRRFDTHYNKEGIAQNQGVERDRLRELNASPDASEDGSSHAGVPGGTTPGLLTNRYPISYRLVVVPPPTPERQNGASSVSSVTAGSATATGA